MLLLDTQTAVWWLTDSPALSERARQVIGSASPAEAIVSVASVWELEIKRARGKFDGLRLDEAAQAAELGLLDITAGHAVRAATLPPLHNDPFDRMILAQAIALGATLVSSDALLPRYGVPVVW